MVKTFIFEGPKQKGEIEWLSLNDLEDFCNGKCLHWIQSELSDYECHWSTFIYLLVMIKIINKWTEYTFWV